MKKKIGSITEHRDRAGRIRYRVRLPDETGERKSLGLYDTLADAEDVRDAALARRGATTGMTLLAWGATWLDRREVEGLHRGVSKSRSVWRAHVAPARFADWPLRRIARTDVVRWVRGLLRTEATSTSTTRGRPDIRVTTRTGGGHRIGRQTVVNPLALLRRALEDAADEGHVSSNVARGVGVPRVPRTTEPWAWLTAAEIAAGLSL